MGVWTPGPGATAGDDIFTGDATNETAAGLAGDDALNGNGGDDTLEGGPGNDVIDGGLGIDTASYATAPGLVRINLWDGGLQDTGSAGFDTLISIENVVGSMFDDILAGTDGDNVLQGGGGDDLLSGLAGNDSLLGGDGGDQLLDDQGDDFLLGGAGDDFLASGAGNDTLEGGSGNDVIDGGAGTDTASYASAPSAVAYNLGAAGPQDTFGAGLDTLSSIENIVGSIFNDELAGNVGANVLEGGAGHDFLDGDFGDDVLDGGAGADGLEGGPGDDVLRGGADNDAIIPGSGSDLLEGGAGADHFLMIDDVGVDAISGGPDLDTVDYIRAEAGVIVQLSGYATTNDAARTLLATFTGVEFVNGSLHNDALIGDAADNIFSDGGGFDWLVGAGGDDLFILSGGGFDRVFGGTQGADQGFDTIDYRIIGGVIVQLSGGYAATNEAIPTPIATFTGIEGAIGTIDDDVLVGDASDNILQGRFGADWLVGGGGDDTFVQVVDPENVDRIFGGTAASDSGVDTIDYSQSDFSSLGGVTLQLSGYATNGATLIATFSGIENAVGTRFDDALIGTAVNNRIAGGAGSDWLVGAGGDDTFVQGVETGVDRLFGGGPGADAGVDTVDYSSASAGVVVQLSGYATTNDASRVTLATFSGIEAVVGSSFNDALIGNAEDNLITGGEGGDWLVGGLGADTFVYQGLGDGSGDSIRDFSRAQIDRIDLAAIDANPLTGADDAFVFANSRHAGVAGEVVVTTFGSSSTVSLYVDADNVADITIQVVHQQGLVMNAGDFIL